MSAIKIDRFGGMIPAWDSRLLPPTQADLSVNCYLIGGNLIGWRQPKLLRALKNSAAKYVYRILNEDPNDTSITAPNSFFMEFEDADTLVIKSPVVDDSFQRYYWASPSTPPSYNTYDRILTAIRPGCSGYQARAARPA